MTSAGPDLRSATVAVLVERFAADARRMGDGRPFVPTRIKRGSPEYEAALSDLRAAARELVARGAAAEFRPLLETDDDSIRSFASTTLAPLDRELAHAAFYGMMYRVPTLEVLRLIRRARAGPPKRPSPTEMRLDQLVDRFVDASTRLYATRSMDVVDEPRDLDLRGDILVEIVEILRELKARGGLEKLLPLLDDGNRWCAPRLQGPASPSTPARRSRFSKPPRRARGASK